MCVSLVLLGEIDRPAAVSAAAAAHSCKLTSVTFYSYSLPCDVTVLLQLLVFDGVCVFPIVAENHMLCRNGGSLSVGRRLIVKHRFF